MKKWIGILVLVAALITAYKVWSSKMMEIDKKTNVESPSPQKEPSYEYDILLDSFDVKKGIVKSGQTTEEILYTNHVPRPEINAIVNHPKLMERPIVTTNKKAILGRPPENILELFS